MGEALAWYLTVQLMAAAVWPLVARALAPLDDRGWGVSKAVGLLGVAWLVWLVCMLTPLPFTRLTLFIAVILIGAASWGWLARRAGFEEIAWLRQRRWLVLAFEAVFLAGFWLFALLRAHNPAIEATEKPMDMAFLNGFMAAQRLPTQDTWLSGYGVPYYHFGYFILACVGKLSGVTAGVAYNLGAASVPALTMVGLRRPGVVACARRERQPGVVRRGRRAGHPTGRVRQQLVHRSSSFSSRAAWLAPTLAPRSASTTSARASRRGSGRRSATSGGSTPHA